MKRTITIILCIVMAASFMLAAGCQVAQAPENAQPSQTADLTAESDSQADLDAVVAKVGDKEITLKEYKQLFEQYKYYYSMFGMDVASDPSTLAQFQDMVKEAMLEKEIVKYQAKLNGVDILSSEQQAAVDKQVDETMSSMREQYTQMANEAKASDDTIDVESYITDMIADDAEYNTGKDMTEDEYRAWYVEEASVEHLRDNLMDLLCKDVSVSDEDVQTWYKDAVAKDKETYTNDPSAFKSAEESFLCAGVDGGNLPVAYVPEGYSRVMDMLIMPKSDVNELYPDYEEKLQKQDSLKAEYGDLAFDDAANGEKANNARMNAIISEYKQLKKETDDMMTDAGKEAKSSIEEAYAKLQEGTTFESLQLRYTENEACASCEALMMDGLFINPDANDGSWSDACIEQFKKLKVGEYSPIFQDEDGYHILYYVSDVTPGERPIEELKDAVKTSLLEDARYTEWTKLLDAWMADGSIVVNEDVYRQVGA